MQRAGGARSRPATPSRDGTLILFGILLVALFYGALPGLAIPTLGQVLWMAGFGQSFANQSLFSIHAINFGAPEPAAIAFGLSGAWLTGFFIRLGLHAADAYALMVLAFLAMAFLSAFALARHFGMASVRAFLAVLLWLSMPIIWGNLGFSMLPLGFALLPLYFLLSLKLFLSEKRNGASFILLGSGYLLTVMTAVFTDGYSFMMFAVLATTLSFFSLLTQPRHARKQLIAAISVHFFSFLAAYVCYTSYLGRTDFGSHSMDYFRAAGLDLTYVVIPSAGQHWLFDWLGASVIRTADQYFGHFSSWSTTFCLPILLGGVIGWWRTRKTVKLAVPIMLVMAFSFYMALGPSLKIDTRKLAEDHTQSMPYMPAERAVMATGNQWIYEKIPGFSQMRFTFRWVALCIFSAWLLFIIFLGEKRARMTLVQVAVLVGLIAFNLPDIRGKFESARENRAMFFEVEKDLIAPLAALLSPDERVAFLPYRNDWMINYVAAKSQIRSFNIGGDKNLYLAKLAWPDPLKKLEYGKLSAPAVIEVLSDEGVDAVVITYFNSLTSSFHWPCTGSFRCPEDYQQEYADIVESVRRSGNYSISETELFAVIRLSP